MFQLLSCCDAGGHAYLRLRKGAEAVAEFQKIVDHKGANWGSDWRYPYWGQFYSLSYVGLARGSALAGETAKAKKSFQDFFELWRDADADLRFFTKPKPNTPNRGERTESRTSAESSVARPILQSLYLRLPVLLAHPLHERLRRRHGGKTALAHQRPIVE